MLFVNNTLVLNKYLGDMVQWQVYLIISNLSYKIWRLWIRLRGIIIELIPIYKGDFHEVKIQIYHQIMGVITKDIFKSFLLYIVVWQDTVLEEAVVKDLLMICANGKIHQYCLIIESISVDYKEQVVITSINWDMQSFIYQVFLKEREKLCKIWALTIHESRQVHIVLQDKDE